MAGLSSSSREQLRAIGVLRWHLFINSLRSIRGRVNLVSRVFAGLLVLAAGFGGGIVLGAVAWGSTTDHNREWLSLLFWLVFLFWQLFPVMATAFNEDVDTSALLRFPLSYPTYFLVRLIYGAMDIATALGTLWCLGIFIGICVADPWLAPWALLVIISFVAFNVLLARMIFVWIEHWLSRRRSKEVLGVIFLLLLIGLQAAGPVLGRLSQRPAQYRWHLLTKLIPLQRQLPPGLAASAVVNGAERRNLSAVGSLAFMTVYGTVVFCILNLSLLNQYRGENPAGGEKRRTSQDISPVRRGWKLPVFSGPVSAIVEKELRYLSRSGPMLFTLIMPMFMVFILWGGRKGFLSQQMGFVFPVGAAYSLLVMTNLIYNNFGGDGGGIQFFLVSPVSFRRIAAGKNLAHAAILAFDVLILWLGVCVIYQPPTLKVMALTLAWYLLASPLNFTAGNLLSIYSPKRIDYSTFGRQRASASTILVSLAVQLAALGTGALAIFIAIHYYLNLWIATLILAALAVPSIAGYFILLSSIDRIAMERREVLATELCRA